MTNIAIRGHKTRGVEVIEILEMLGGKSNGNMRGYNDDLYYFIATDGLIYGSGIEWEDLANKFLIFTLEEFDNKYPYKVGDKVGNTIICGMRWEGKEIVYCTNDSKGYITCRDLINNNYPKDINMNACKDSEKEWTKQVAYLTINEGEFADKVELNLNGYEIEVFDGKTYFVKKKPKYPKTYVDCCDVLGYKNRNNTIQDFLNSCDLYDFELMTRLSMLKLCRDAYWKIAGEEMGLGKPWEPDWTDDYRSKYIITCVRNELINDFSNNFNYILAFPTEEMRDVFYENFKTLIEECKAFL